MLSRDVSCPNQAVGVLSSAYTSGWLVEKVGARPVLALMALFPLLMCFTACLIKDRRQGYAAPEDVEAGTVDACTLYP
jgi:fucose permease